MENTQFIYCDKQRINLNSILWLEGDWNYTRIYQKNKAVSLSAYTLKRYERQLTEFIRVRKNAMVNPKHVDTIVRISGKPGRLILVLSNGEEIEVTRRRQGLVRKQFGASPFIE